VWPEGGGFGRVEDNAYNLMNRSFLGLLNVLLLFDPDPSPTDYKTRSDLYRFKASVLELLRTLLQTREQKRRIEVLVDVIGGSSNAVKQLHQQLETIFAYIKYLSTLQASNVTLSLVNGTYFAQAANRARDVASGKAARELAEYGAKSAVGAVGAVGVASRLNSTGRGAGAADQSAGGT